LETLCGSEVARVDGIGVVRCVAGVTGEVVKGGGLEGGRVTDVTGNENTEVGGRETGRLLRIELGVCGREVAE
jgi:hypothetical protein